MSEQILNCANCRVVIEPGSEVGLIGESNKPEDMLMVCINCHDAQDYSNIAQFARASSKLELSGPLVGKFKPCKTNEEIIDERQKSFYREYWNRMEKDVLDMLVGWQDRFLRIVLSSRTYKGYRIVFHWSDGALVGLEFPGNTSAVKPPMTVYQVHRLRAMGLEGEGLNPPTWTLALEGPEADLENVVRVISHVLDYGYLIDAARVDAITPILEREKKTE